MPIKRQSDPDKLLKKHTELIHSTDMKVASHVQRREGEWIINTIMIEGYDVPFRYKRKKEYKNVKGVRVNMTYYADTVPVAGFDMQIMTVVRIKIS